MKSFRILVQALVGQPESTATDPGRWNGEPGCQVRARKAVFAAVVLVLAVCWGAVCSANAQVVPAADRGGIRLSAGGLASGYYVQYGEVKLLGPAAFVDVDTLRHFGFEGEARWLDFHRTHDFKATTYLGGIRYHREIGRFDPYVKGLVGLGQFHYTYGLGHDNDLVVAPGGGLDFHLSHRIILRAADFEYQIWPQFHYGSMSSVGVSTGIRVRIF
jgi:hypothetical protein